MSDQRINSKETDSAEESIRDVVREFCRSHGAPTADWLGRLTKKGREECIRHWLLKVTSPEIQSLLPAVAEELFEQCTKNRPFFYDALSVEELQERVESAKRDARNRVEAEVRYGAIGIDEITSSQPWVKYDEYRDLCDREWKRMVKS